LISKIKKLILILIIAFNANLSFGQLPDSMLNDVIEKIKSTKEGTYDFKGKELPGYEMTLLNGSNVDSETLKGKPTLIFFWFNTCQPCLDIIPLLHQIKTKFANEVYFVAISINNQNDVYTYISPNKFEFTHVIASKEYLSIFRFFGYPKTLILDKNLTILDIEKKLSGDLINNNQNQE
jgi:thiol-disulfide isomerase/thioredoxin